MANQGQNCSSILIAWKMGHIRMMRLACRNMKCRIHGKSKVKEIFNHKLFLPRTTVD